MRGWLARNWVALADAVVTPITNLAGRVDITNRRAVTGLVHANARRIGRGAVDRDVVRA